MTIRFLARAVTEYDDAIEYYDLQQPGLGLDFALAVDNTLARIQAHPKAWHLLTQDVRRCLVTGFPYGIMYAIEPDVILVLSVFNLNRSPQDLPL